MCQVFVGKLECEDADVAQQRCGAVWNLAANNADNKKELGQIGACDAVVKALKRFGAENADVAGCRTIVNLVSKNEDNIKELGIIGACDAVVKALKRFGVENADIAANGCNAVALLAVDDDYRQELDRVGSCDAVVKALKRFGEEDESVPQSAYTAVCCLDLTMTTQKNSFELELAMRLSKHKEIWCGKCICYCKWM